MINRMVDHFRRWNIWRKSSLNGPLHKLLVLFRVIESPTMCYVLLPEEESAFFMAVQKRIAEGITDGKTDRQYGKLLRDLTGQPVKIVEEENANKKGE